MNIRIRIKEHLKKHFASKHEERQQFYDQQMEFQSQQRKLRLEQQRLRRQLQYLRHFRHGRFSKEQEDIIKRLAEIQSQQDQMHMRSHIHHYQTGTDADFKSYYHHILGTRLAMIFFNLALWGVLFWVSGLSIGLTIVAVFFAVSTTAGSLFEILFQLRIRERILKPVENLKRGVQEVAQGNYNVKVENENSNEIASLIKAFNEMAQKLSESEAIKHEYEENRKTLVTNISHDLKTPITSIQGFVEALEDNKLPAEKAGRYLEIIKSNAEYMNRLVDDLFLFSKLDMQRLDFHFEQLRIRPFLQDMMDEFSIDLEDRNVRFTYMDGLDHDCLIRLDGKRFNQILRNLIGNAVKYGAHEKPVHIQVRLYETDGWVRLDIADNGPGIPPENVPHIFERFYRVDAERTKNLESTGLGLAIAKELTEAHGGTITVKSEPGAGTCFTVSLPAATTKDGEI